MTPYPDFALTSEHRNVPIFQYAKGEGFPWESFVQHIGADTLDPHQVDMLHALNWIKRHLHTYQPLDKAHEDYNERCAASLAWCHLYPRVPPNVQAHLVMMLGDAPKATEDQMHQFPSMWQTALSQAWGLKEDMALWTTLFKLMPAQIQHVPLQTANLGTALKLLTGHIYQHIHTPTQSDASLSDHIYDGLLAHALPPLRAQLELMRALYPDLEELPKVPCLISAMNNCPTTSSGARHILELYKQAASNLNAAMGNTMALSVESTPLPANAFEP